MTVRDDSAFEITLELTGMDVPTVQPRDVETRPWQFMNWHYVDHKSKIQGPFTATQMALWHKQKQIKPATRVRYSYTDKNGRFQQCRFRRFDQMFPYGVTTGFSAPGPSTPFLLLPEETLELMKKPVAGVFAGRAMRFQYVFRIMHYILVLPASESVPSHDQIRSAAEEMGITNPLLDNSTQPSIAYFAGQDESDVVSTTDASPQSVDEKIETPWSSLTEEERKQISSEILERLKRR